jgi:hypothetical protein
MKKILISLGLIFASQVVLADASLLCHDQTSSAVYKLELGNRLNINNRYKSLVLSPEIKDDSNLSLSIANLHYNEGESSDDETLYEGNNLDQITVIVEIDTKSLSAATITTAVVSYTGNDTSKLDQRTKLSCSLVE